jgi:hypothetical protein
MQPRGDDEHIPAIAGELRPQSTSRTRTRDVHAIEINAIQDNVNLLAWRPLDLDQVLRRVI